MSELLFSHPVSIVEAGNETHLVRGSNRFIVDEPSNGIALKIIIALTSNGIALNDLLTEFAETEREAVRSLVDALLSRKILTKSEDLISPDPESPNDTFFWHFNLSRKDYVDRLDYAFVIIVGINELSLELTKILIKSGVSNLAHIDDPLLRNASFFDQAGIIDGFDAPLNIISSNNVSQWDNESTLLVVCSEFGTSYPVRAWNKLCVEAKIKMLPVILRELRGFIGPIFHPDSSACFECLIAREQANTHSNVDNDLWTRFESTMINKIAYTNAMIGTLANIVAGEVIKIFTSIVMVPGNELINVALIDPSIKRHPVYRVPRCPHCSPALWRPSLSIVKDEFKNKIIAGR